MDASVRGPGLRGDAHRADGSGEILLSGLSGPGSLSSGGLEVSAVARFPGTKSYGKTRTRGKRPALRNEPRLTAYQEYQLETAREAVEEEIAASAFVRGAWRQLKERRTA